MLYVKCSHDLYGGDTVADKWYEVIQIDPDGFGFTFYDETGFVMYCLTKNCAHLKDTPNAS